MANKVFANGRELACKAGAGKTIADFPDVCFTPPDKVPPTPPGVPVPYPNNGKSKDLTKGSKNVKISKKEVMLRDKSYYKKSTGNEAAKTAKKGLMSSKLTGKVYFTSWSMDVKCESSNVVRHLDTTTGNHASPMANAACPWPNIDTASIPKLPPKPCTGCKKKTNKATKKKMRQKTPSDDVKKTVNKRSKNCAVCGANPSPKKLAADHIVPYQIIQQMPGFACMSEEDQVKTINSPDNFIGLCGSCNSSKSSKLWYRWKRHKKRGLDLTGDKFADTRKKAEEATKANIKKLKATIRAAECV